MTPQKQLETCCICLDEIAINSITQLDSCTHTYCHPCIDKWVKEVENKCPQCKQKIHKITYTDVLGMLKSTKVSNKVQQYDEYEDMHCETCNERVYERDFDALGRDENSAALCD